MSLESFNKKISKKEKRPEFFRDLTDKEQADIHAYNANHREDIEGKKFYQDYDRIGDKEIKALEDLNEEEEEEIYFRDLSPKEQADIHAYNANHREDIEGKKFYQDYDKISKTLVDEIRKKADELKEEEEVTKKPKKKEKAVIEDSEEDEIETDSEQEHPIVPLDDAPLEVVEETEKEKDEEEQEFPIVPVDDAPLIETDEEKEPEKIKILGGKKIGIVKTTDALDKKSLDTAKKALSDKEKNLSGFSGYIKRIWTHNIALEYNTQKEKIKAKQAMLGSKNLFATDGFDKSVYDEVRSTMAERFIQDYEEVIHEGESRSSVENASTVELKDLIKKYTRDEINEEVLSTESKKHIAAITDRSIEEISSDLYHADNIIEIAKQCKLAISHNISLEQIDQEIDELSVILGDAKVGVRTEADLNKVDRLINKMTKYRIGSLALNEIAVALAVSSTYATSAFLGRALIMNKAVAYGTLGLSAVLGGAIIGRKESKRVKEERAQHSREMAQGFQYDQSDKRRDEINDSTYSLFKANQLTGELNNHIGNLDSEEKQLAAIDILALAINRVGVSDRNNVDLLAYSSIKNVEKERLDLDISIAKLKIELNKLNEDGKLSLPNNVSFDQFLNQKIDSHKTTISGEIKEKDRVFNKIKRKRVTQKFIAGSLGGLSVGVAAQEAVASFHGNQQGFFEGMLNRNEDAKSETALESLRQYLSNDTLESPIISQHTLPDGSEIRLPENIEIIQNAGSSTFTLLRDGHAIITDLEIDNGAFPDSSKELLDKYNISISENVVSVVNPTTTTEVLESHEFITNHPENFEKIHRDFWYDNNTVKFDKNELDLHFGGINRTGIDADGNYVYDLNRMTSSGSVHKDASIDLKEALKSGKMNLLFSLSRDTQFEVFKVPFNEDGLAIIDPHTEIGKQLFEVNDDQLVFKGRFAEVAHQIGTAEDGIDNYAILATDEGQGINSVETKVIHEGISEQTISTLNSEHIPKDTDLPFVIPLVERKPFEKTTTQKYINERLHNNPDITLDEGEEVKNYVSQFSPEYNEMLTNLSRQANKINKECMLSICIPVVEDDSKINIEKLVKHADKQTAKKESFELVFLLNENTGNYDNNLAKLKQYKKDYPELNIQILHKDLDPSEIKDAKKILTDTVVKRQSKEKDTKHSISILSNKAEYIDEGYVSKTLEEFHNKPIDAISYDTKIAPEDITKDPLTGSVNRFTLNLSKHHDIKKHSSDRFNSNTVFKTASYAAVGGYTLDEQSDDVTNLLSKLKEGRSGALNNKAVINDESSETSIYIKSNEAVDMVNKRFTKLVEESKTTEDRKSNKKMLTFVNSLEEGIRHTKLFTTDDKVNYGNNEEYKKFSDKFENIINKSLNGFNNYSPKQREAIKKSLNHIGIRFVIDRNFNIRIKDAQELRLNLIKDKEKASNI